MLELVFHHEAYGVSKQVAILIIRNNRRQNMRPYYLIFIYFSMRAGMFYTLMTLYISSYTCELFSRFYIHAISPIHCMRIRSTSISHRFIYHSLITSPSQVKDNRNKESSLPIIKLLALISFFKHHQENHSLSSLDIHLRNILISTLSLGEPVKGVDQMSPSLAHKGRETDGR